MQVKILYFATFRSLTGYREEVLTLQEGATLQELLGGLVELHPAIQASLPSAILAINREFALAHDVLHDGDEVAIFPPVSGGGASGRKGRQRTHQNRRHSLDIFVGEERI